jgi:hypothetical protein
MIDLGSGFTDAIGLEDGTDDIASMPPLITHAAAQPRSTA